MYQPFVLFLLGIFASSVLCLPPHQASRHSSYPVAEDVAAPLVFAHYMLCTRPPDGGYTNDIKLAQDVGISAFALNYGGWGVDFSVQDGYLSDLLGRCKARLHGLHLYRYHQCKGQ